MTKSSLSLLALLAFVVLENSAVASLRIDFSNTSGRSDTRTFAWHNWEIGTEQQAEQTVDGVTIVVRGTRAPLEGFLTKADLATGATLGADGVQSAGPIEIELRGLAPGKHSLATFHNVVSGTGPASLTTTIATASITTPPSVHARHNDDCATNFVEFEVVDGQPAIVTIHGRDAESSAVINGLELDLGNPRTRASRPQPRDFDEHAEPAGDQMLLKWQSVPDARAYRVYAAHGRQWEQVAESLRVAEPSAGLLQGEVQTNEYKLPVAPHNGLEHYCWRVDAVDRQDHVTRGCVWSFRVAHLAFPGAEGYGRFAIGGRGGRVVHVTSLADAGPGTLRAALEERGPRTIVFDVSGRVQLASSLTIRDNFITIAGQTAPGNGICVSNFNLGMLGAHDNIIRYIRVRPGDQSGETLDGMGLASSDHSIVDHCSISWTHDEAFSSRGARNVTLQRTLISEALNVAGHRKYPPGTAHGYAASISGDIGSFHHNLLAHCAGRNWSLAGGIDQANVHAGRLDIRNNVVYNWSHRTTDGGAKQVQFVNNFYKPGPATHVFHVLKPERNHAFGPQDYYVLGNVMWGRTPADDRYGAVVVPKDEPLSKFCYDEPFYEHYVTTQSAEDAYHDVLADVGCNVPSLDAHDRRVIDETAQGTAKFKGSRSGLPGLPDSQEDVGGWDEYPELHRPADWDADGDGMPTAWETVQQLDPQEAADAAADADGDGYTNLEEYLAELAGSR